MDVGAVSYDKGKKGGKTKSDNKGGKFDKKGKPPPPKKFNGECSYCGKWGRKKADCRLLAKEKAKREGKGKGNSTNAIAAASSSATGSASPSGGQSTNAVYYWLPGDGERVDWADAEDVFEIEDEYSDEMWVMMIHRSKHLLACQPPDRKIKYLLWDSGSDEHLCRPSLGGDYHTEESEAKLMGISGQCLGRLGKKKVNYKIIGEDKNFLNAVTEFKVSEHASKDVLSAGKMSRNGFAADMRNPKKPFLTHPKARTSRFLCTFTATPTTSRRGTTRRSPLDIDLGTGVMVAPVAGQGEEYEWEYAGIEDEGEGIEMVPIPAEFAEDEAHARADRPRLHGWSKVEDTRARLRELKEPIYGDKHTLWKRLQAAERALSIRRARARDYVEKICRQHLGVSSAPEATQWTTLIGAGLWSRSWPRTTSSWTTASSRQTRPLQSGSSKAQTSPSWIVVLGWPWLCLSLERTWRRPMWSRQ